MHEFWNTLSFLKHIKNKPIFINIFLCIRASFGGCTNPTIVQFTSAYKKLFPGACNKTKYNSCSLQDDTKLLVISSNPEIAAKTFVIRLNNALTYSSRFVHRKLLKKETRLSCHEFLAKTTIRSAANDKLVIVCGHSLHGLIPTA